MFQNPEKGSSFTNDKVVTHTCHSGKGEWNFTYFITYGLDKSEDIAEPRMIAL